MSFQTQAKPAALHPPCRQAPTAQPSCWGTGAAGGELRDSGIQGCPGCPGSSKESHPMSKVHPRQCWQPQERVLGQRREVGSYSQGITIPAAWAALLAQPACSLLLPWSPALLGGQRPWNIFSLQLSQHFCLLQRNDISLPSPLDTADPALPAAHIHESGTSKTSNCS